MYPLMDRRLKKSFKKSLKRIIKQINTGCCDNLSANDYELLIRSLQGLHEFEKKNGRN
jgi:hypothetical protein